MYVCLFVIDNIPHLLQIVIIGALLGWGEITENYKMSLGREKSLFERPRHRYEYNIKMDLKSKKSDDVSWIKWLRISFFRELLRIWQ
jgi:hypothetical protein